jgi:hypothetical protein
MLEQDKIFDTLLRGLSDEDYDALIAQEKLRLDDYSLHFIVDTNLIHNYCYPYGILKGAESGDRVQLSENYIEDEQIALHCIFKLNKGDNRLIFLDEYLYEFQGMIYKASKLSKQSNDNIDISLINISMGDGDIKDLLFNKFSKIFSDIVLNINGLKKATNLFKERSIIFESNQFENKLIAECALNCRGQFKSASIIEKIFRNIGKFKGELYPNTNRDVIIIDRLLEMNNYIKNTNLAANKKIFIFLSDSFRLKQVYDYILKNDRKLDYPEINGSRINLFRNLPQTFAYLISLAYNKRNEVDHERTIANLITLKEANQTVRMQVRHTEKLLKRNTIYGSNFDLFDSSEYREIFLNYKRLRNIFENTGLLKSYNSLYESIKNDIKFFNNEELTLFFDRISLEMLSLAKELDKVHASYLEKLKNEAIFTTTFINSLGAIREEKKTFDISKGDDYIESTYQHLPIFLIFPNDTTDYHIHMNKLMMLVLEGKSEDSQKLYQELQALLISMENSSYHIQQQIEVNLIKSFIFMILPSTLNKSEFDSGGKGKHNDKIAYKWLNLLAETPIKDHHLNSDLKYLMCWVLRRTCKYEESYKLAKDGIKLYNDDPRFYHGKFLALYCLYEEGRSKRRKSEIVEEMLEDLKKAHAYYIPFIKSMFFQFNVGFILKKLEEVYNNNICYILSLKAFLMSSTIGYDTKGIELLREARTYFEAINESYNYLELMPEYYDTESFLEYVESLYFQDKMDRINAAKRSILKAISLSKSSSLTTKYSARLHIIEERISSLQ